MAKFSDFMTGLAEDPAPDVESDMVMAYDASAGGLKKVRIQNLAGEGGSGTIDAGGWSAADEFTFASADAPSFTVTCPGDQTGKYSPGMRVKLAQGTLKFFIITGVSYSAGTGLTTLTLYGGTHSTLANEAVATPSYSTAKVPVGFPADPTLWTVVVKDTANRSQSSPAANTWYNLGSLSIQVPPGLWLLEYTVRTYVEINTTEGWPSAWVTLSTANNTESDAEFSTYYEGTRDAAGGWTHSRQKIVSLSAKTTYSLNERTSAGGCVVFAANNTTIPCILRALCAYL